MFSLVSHNAVGTVHSFMRGFLTVEEAASYRERFGYAGLVNCPIIRAEDEPRIREINDRWSLDARRLYVA
jgi:hypothetical protein